MKKIILSLLLVFLSITLSLHYIHASDNQISMDYGLNKDWTIGGITAITVTVICWLILGKFILKQEPKQQIVKLGDNYKSLSLEELKILDMSYDKFKLKIYEKFIDIHTAWQNFDYDKLRENVSDELFKFYVSELEKYKKKNYQNIMRDFELIDMKIYNIRNLYDLLHVDVYLCVRMFDYTENTVTGECVKGNNIEKMDFEYELTFVKGLRTKCSKCGWLVSVDDDKCMNCQADIKIKKDDNNYIMSKKICINKMKVNNLKKD